MVQKSNNSKTELIRAIGEEMQRSQDVASEFDGVAAAVMGLNRTDLRCLGVIVRHAPVAAGEVARIASLSRAATTAALDRLENGGYARRVADQHDRRSVRVEPTKLARDWIERIWGPLESLNEKLLALCSIPELRAICGFVERGREGQEAHLETVRSFNKDPESKGGL